MTKFVEERPYAKPEVAMQRILEYRQLVRAETGRADSHREDQRPVPV
ncbi:hypothetical protein [Bradyrhizobium neotropicale]|nr:hypothetical protein [Bradyrhizobium neotropicale]